jgi:hypothetical protein
MKRFHHGFLVDLQNLELAAVDLVRWRRDTDLAC